MAATSTALAGGNRGVCVSRRDFLSTDFFRLRSRHVLFPSAKALEKLLEPFIGRFEHHLLADAVDDHLALVVGETAGLRQADGLAAAMAEELRPTSTADGGPV